MTRKLNNDNSLQDWKTEHQAVTHAHVLLPKSAIFEVYSTLVKVVSADKMRNTKSATNT